MARRPHLSWRGGVTALTVLALGATMLALGGSAIALNGNRTGPLDTLGFPRYYMDQAGRGLRLCLDGSAMCDGVQRGDLTPPDGEALYWAALSPLRTRRGTLSVEFALEAAFEGRRAVVFRRLRVRGHLRVPGRYVLRHPYGTLRFRAITPREQRNVNVTVDSRCARTRGGRCAPRMERWLTSRNRVEGYLGARRRTPVRGGEFRNNLLLFAPNGRLIGRSEQFRVIGKVCGPRCRTKARRAARQQ